MTHIYMKSGHKFIFYFIFLICYSIFSYAVDPSEYYKLVDDQLELSEKILGTEEDIESFKGLPENVRIFLQYERFFNDRINHEDFEPITPEDVPIIFRPESNVIFKVWSVEIPYSKLKLTYSEPALIEKLPRGFVKTKNGEIYITFIVHPLSYFYYKDILKEYEWNLEFLALPTSSYRSMIIWKPEFPNDPVYVKLSLFLNIGGFTRILDETDLLKATSNTTIINSMGEINKSHLNFENMAEMVSILPNGAEGGMIIRDIEPIVKNIILPMFSLYSKNQNVAGFISNMKPILYSLIDASGVSAKKYISDQIISPLIEIALYFYFKLGLTSHFHEQNVLLRLNPNEEMKFWVRDNEQFYMDIAGYMRYAATQKIDPHFDYRKPVPNIMFFKKTENPIDEMITYIRDSNLYALQHGVVDDYPEITLEWINKEFEEILIKKARKYIAGNYKTLAGLKRAIVKDKNKWNFVLEKIRSLEATIPGKLEINCQDMFLIN